MSQATGLPIRFEPAGKKPADVPGHVWVDEKNPYAGNCEAQWQWALYKLAEESK